MIKLTFAEPSKVKQQDEIEKYCLEIYESMDKGYKQYLNLYCKKHSARIIKHLIDERPAKAKLGKYLINTLFKKHNHKRFIAFFDTRVCPYCNRNYIGDINSNTIYHLDHFWPKDDYPILAASFFNLVPSCASCN